MNPKKLYSEDKIEKLKPEAQPDALSCCECEQPFHSSQDDSADRCCRCLYCGKKGEKHLPQHDHLSHHRGCYDAAAAARRKEDRDVHFADPQAGMKTVTAAEWGDKPVFFCYEGPQDGYFNSLSELGEHLEAEEASLPRWVYASERKTLYLEARQIVESALEDHHEDAGEDIGENDVSELQGLLDLWCCKQNVVTYEVDYDLAVLL